MCFKAFQIVFSSDQKRLQNHADTVRKFGDALTKFEAINSIDDFDSIRKFALENNYCTDAYLQQQDGPAGFRGKLGCNLSHQVVLEQIRDNDFYGKHWFLILEDDVVCCDSAPLFIEKLIAQLEGLNRDFVQLQTFERYSYSQFVPLRHMFDELYNMIPQWGTGAYLISRPGIEHVLSKFPVDVNIDSLYSNEIAALKAVCCRNDVFVVGGQQCLHAQDGGEFGSLIWESRVVPEAAR